MQPDDVPAAPRITGANYDSRRVREGARRRAGGVGLRRASRRAGDAPRRAATSKQLGIGVSTYVEVTAPVGLHVECGAVEVNDDGIGQRVRRHQRARPGPPHRVRDARQRGARHPDGQDHARQLRHRPRAARCRHDGLALAADRGQRHPRRVRTRCSTGPSRSPRTCSRRRPTTSSPATAACTSPACRRRRCRGPSSRSASRDASKLPDGLEPGAAAPRARLRRHRLDVPVRRPRVGRRGRHRDRRGHDAAPHRRRRLRPHPQPAAGRRPAARRHRPGRGAGAVRVGAVRRRRQPASRRTWPTTRCRRRPSCAASRRRTPRPTARATRSARRASASRARSARRRRSRTPSSTPCRHLGVTHIDMPCTGRARLARDPGGFGLGTTPRSGVPVPRR